MSGRKRENIHVPIKQRTVCFSICVNHPGSFPATKPLYNDKGGNGYVMAVVIKRVYEPPSRDDGTRVLVDRLWPRGLTKAAARVDEWLRDLAPSNELRRWYHAQPGQWQAFRKKYLKELAKPEYQNGLHRLFELAHETKQLTLLFASKNESLNNAVVLRELLEGARKPPRGAGAGAVQATRKRATARRR